MPRLQVERTVGMAVACDGLSQPDALADNLATWDNPRALESVMVMGYFPIWTFDWSRWASAREFEPL